MVKETTLYMLAVPDQPDRPSSAGSAKKCCERREGGQRGADGGPNASYTLPAQNAKRWPAAGRLRWLSMRHTSAVRWVRWEGATAAGWRGSTTVVASKGAKGDDGRRGPVGGAGLLERTMGHVGPQILYLIR